MMALQLSEDRISFTERRNQIIDGLHAMPAQIKRVLEQDSQLQQLASTVADNKSLLIMGRGYQYVLAYSRLFRYSYSVAFQIRHMSRRCPQNQGNQLHAL